MIGLVFAILSALGFGLANGISQRYVRDIGIGPTMLVRSVVTSLILFALFFAFPHELSLEGLGIAALVLSLGIIAVLSYYRSLSVGISGIVTPVANSAVIVTLLVGALFFSESLGAPRYALIGLIVAGAVLLSHERGSKRRIAAGIPFALGAMVFWGLTYALLHIPTRMVGPIMTPLVGELLALAIGAAMCIRYRERIPLDRETLLPLVAIGVFIVFGVAGFTFALQEGVPAGIVAAISASNPAVTALYMRIAHGETLSWGQRLGSLLVIIGVVALSMLGA